MHIHILGICGTFMGGVAVLAKAAGHTVSGCDSNVYPPMSDQLESQGIRLIEGFGPEQVDLAPDLFVIGNVVSRGNPLMEAILDRGLAYQSGPQWLAEQVLSHCRVVAVAGTHGKTTTASMVAWILDAVGLRPGFLIGGVPRNFGVSARLPGEWRPASGCPSLNDAPWFVIEADEYDTAFFDKRSKFVHYHPRVAVLNNLEFDHADIFASLDEIVTQFHHLVRTIPGTGTLVVNGASAALERVLTMGSWTPVVRFGSDAEWQAVPLGENGMMIMKAGEIQARLGHWSLLGEHNRANALAAVLAGAACGSAVEQSVSSLGHFLGVKRRMELRGEVRGVRVYDDFAHHPTAICTTLAGLRRTLDPDARIIALLEPRSNTMKMGIWSDSLAASLNGADRVFGYDAHLGWNLGAALAPLGERATVENDLESLVTRVALEAREGDVILVMSNGSFGGVHERLLERLRKAV